MRRMRTLLFAALALVALFGFGRPGAAHADAECIEILAEGGTVTDCQEAPNPLLPETNEIIWGAVGFLVVFLFLAKFGMPQMRTAMNNRTEKIRSDIQA